MAAVVLAILAAAGAWARSPALPLVQVTDLAPRDLEVGDRLAIFGAGFPPGKTAHVTFRGDLARPGQRRETAVAIEAVGTAVSPEKVEVEITEPVEALFCGPGEGAVHTAFQGEVEIAFAAVTPGAPPVAGTLRDVTLDLRPTARPGDASRDAEGQRLLAFVGLHATAAARESGLLVDAVDPGSRAEEAAVRAGDVIVRWGGVRAAGAADVLPSPGAREASIRVRHEGSALETVRRIRLDGYRDAAPGDLVLGWVAVWTALAVVGLACGPGAGPVARRLQWAIANARARLGPVDGQSSAATVLRSALTRAAQGVRPPFAPSLAVDLAFYAVVALVPFSQYGLAARLDVGAFFVVAAASLAAGAASRARSLPAGALEALRVLWAHAPAALALSSVVLATGSLRIHDVACAQGGLPWEWLAFRSPASLLGLAVLGQTLWVDVGDETPPSTRRTGLELAARAVAHTARGPASAPVRLHHALVAALMAAIFLGGWTIPGVAPAVQDAHPGWQALGALVYAAKVAALVIAAAAIRACGPFSHVAASKRVLLVDAPLALTCLALTFVWNRLAPSSALQTLVSASLLLGTTLLVGAVATRFLSGLAAPRGEVRLSALL